MSGICASESQSHGGFSNCEGHTHLEVVGPLTGPSMEFESQLKFILEKLYVTQPSEETQATSREGHMLFLLREGLQTRLICVLW